MSNLKFFSLGCHENLAFCIESTFWRYIVEDIERMLDVQSLIDHLSFWLIKDADTWRSQKLILSTSSSGELKMEDNNFLSHAQGCYYCITIDTPFDKDNLTSNIAKWAQKCCYKDGILLIPAFNIIQTNPPNSSKVHTIFF